jgi:hypothetical protein
VKVPAPLVNVQSPWPVLVVIAIVSVVATAEWVLEWAVIVTAAGAQFTAVPGVLTA